MNQNLRKALLVIIAVLIALLVVIGASYAYMQNRIESQELTNVDLRTCAKIQLLDGDSNVINMTNTYPMDDKLGLETPSYEFTISSTCQTYVGASIYLTSLKDNSIEDQYIKFALRNDQGEILKTGLLNSLTNVTETDEFTQEEIYQLDIGIKGSHKNIYKSVSEVIPYQGSKKYSLQLWITSSATDKTVPFGSTFKLGVSIKAYERGMENYLTLGDKTTSFYRNDKYRDKIKNVYFVNSIEEKTDSIAEWDLSTFQDNSIIGWLKNNDSGDENAPYDLYIGSNDVIKANSFENAFYNMTNVETITLANLNTDELTTMRRMFAGTDETEMKLHEINGLSELNVSNVTNMHSLFFKDTNLTSLDLSNWNTESVTNMSYMFDGDSSLQNIEGIDNFQTGKVTTMYAMFSKSNISALNLSNWDTSSVTDMSYMFYGDSSLQNIEGIDNFQTGKVTTMYAMFSKSNISTLNLSNWDTSSVTDMSFMFNKCANLTTIEGLNNFKTDKVTTMQMMFNEDPLLTDLDVTNWNTSSVTNMSYMFSDDTALATIEGIEGFQTENVTTMLSMFSKTRIVTLNLSGWDTSNVENMGWMFNSCTNLTSIEGINNFETGKVTDMTQMFYGVGITTLDLSGWDTSNVEKMGWMFNGASNLANLDLSNWKFPEDFDVKGMIGDLKKLPKLNTLNLSNWDTSSITDMSWLFSRNEVFKSLNLSGWDTSNVTTLEGMFYSCTNLSEIIGIEKWNVKKVKSTKWLFSSNKFAQMDLSQWQTSSLDNMAATFENCVNLTKVNLSGWDTSNVTDMGFLFNDSVLLKDIIGLEGFKTNNVTTMQNMFYNLQNIQSLNLSTWNTPLLENVGHMFYNNTSLESLDIRNATFTNVNIKGNMFTDVSSSIKITVKDSAAQKFIQDLLGSGKGKVTIA